jgi:hypothetical protein
MIDDLPLMIRAAETRRLIPHPTLLVFKSSILNRKS